MSLGIPDGGNGGGGRFGGATGDDIVLAAGAEGLRGSETLILTDWRRLVGVPTAASAATSFRKAVIGIDVTSGGGFSMN